MRPCSRTIDKPLLILGLEGEDIGVLMLLCGVPAVVFSPTIPLLSLLGAWPALAVLKRGKPSGYMLHLFYSLGMPMEGLLPPGEANRYSPYPGITKKNRGKSLQMRSDLKGLKARYFLSDTRAPNRPI